ncbi:rRNA small subunit pseudouridine methyltransferase Nep1 [Trifolium repens]|nr:rRNA small subunit pseudouridine methyltransferase Nep1 [Trifolium repens]
MTRAYSVKGKKRKNKDVVEEEDDEEQLYALLSILDSPLNKAGRNIQTVRWSHAKTASEIEYICCWQAILLRTIKNPITQYLPINSRKAGLSFSSEKLVGAMTHGKIETDYTEDYIAVSGDRLSAAHCITRICNSIEGKWNIL